MPRKTPLTSLKQISEINLTPLMDLTFILLITFIITFPLIEQGIQIRLPEAKASALPEQSAQTISIDREGRIFLDNQAVDAAELAVRMKRLGSTDPGCSVLVRADERIAYREVVRVLRILHEARITRMALVTRAEQPAGS